MRQILLANAVARRQSGANNLSDMLKLKLGLERLGYYPAKSVFTPGADDDLWEGIKRYQASRGLEIDGVAMPNGPTLAKLNEDLQETSGRGSLIGTRPLDAPLPGEVVNANRRMARSLGRSSAVGDLPTFMVSALKSSGETAPAEVADLLAQAHEVVPRQAGRLRLALDDYLDRDDMTRFDAALRSRLGKAWDQTTAAATKERDARHKARDGAMSNDTPSKENGREAQTDGRAPPSADQQEWRSRYPDLGDIGKSGTRLDLPNGTLTPDYRDEIARRESNVKGYRSVNGEALGRYQLTRRALQQLGMKNANGDWTGKYGIRSNADFLADPEIQEKAFEDYSRDNDQQLRNNGAKAYLGQRISGIKAEFTITEGGLAAAAHRQGAGAVKQYLDYLESKGWKSDVDKLPDEDERKTKFLSVETRLREFERISPRKEKP